MDYSLTELKKIMIKKENELNDLKQKYIVLKKNIMEKYLSDLKKELYEYDLYEKDHPNENNIEEQKAMSIVLNKLINLKVTDEDLL